VLGPLKPLTRADTSRGDRQRPQRVSAVSAATLP